MKTFLTDDFPFDTGQKGVKAKITLNVCPFCGEPVQRPPDSMRNFIREVPHADHNCADWVQAGTTWFRGEDDMAIGFFIDGDGDWWAFLPERDYESADHFLRPIDLKRLRGMLDAALAQHNRYLDGIKRATAILMNTETP